MTTREEYVKLIAEYDRLLGIIRKHYVAAKPEDLPTLSGWVNNILDDRMRLMKLRDTSE